MARKIFGLDIREDAISAVLVKSGLKGSKVEAYAYRPLDNSEDGFSAALQTLFESIDIRGAFCIAALPAEVFFYRNLTVPFKDLKKVKQILPFELEPALPVPVEDLLLDYHALPLTGNPQQTDVFVASVQRRRLQEYLGVLSDLKINPDVITIGGYAAALWLSRTSDFPENGLIADIGTARCTLFVIFSGQICLVRSFPIAVQEAGRTESICMNIQRTLYAFKEMQDADFNPELVLITGNGNMAEHPETHLSERLGLPVRRGDILHQNARISIKSQETLSWNPFQTDNAAALVLAEAEGLKGFNFRKGPFAPRNYWIENRHRLFRTGIIAAIMLILGIGNVLFDAYDTRRKIARLDQEIMDIFRQTFPDVKRIIDPLHQMQAKIDERRKSTLSPMESETSVRLIDMLNEVSKRIPTAVDVEFTRLVVGPGSLLISGDTDTFNTVDDIKSRLEGIAIFKAVKINSANIDRSDNRVRFKLKIDL